jgi:hypothetical protein
VDRARGRALGELIEELSFNLTISLMHNDLLTQVTLLQAIMRRTANTTLGIKPKRWLLSGAMSIDMGTIPTAYGSRTLSLHYSAS